MSLPETTSEIAAPPSNRSALLIVFLVVFIDLLGFGIVLPLLPLYATELLEPIFPGQDAGAAALRGAGTQDSLGHRSITASRRPRPASPSRPL